MLGEGLSGMLSIWLSCVCTDWKCVLNICLVSGVVINVSVLSFNDVIVLVSCLCILKNLKSFFCYFLHCLQGR